MDGGTCGLRKRCPGSQGSRAPGGDGMGHVVKSQREDEDRGKATGGATEVGRDPSSGEARRNS